MYSYSKYSRSTRGPGRGIFIFVFFVAAFLLLGAIVMLLWNAILPEVTSARPLSYWQALGLLVLSRILFGGFRFGKPGGGPATWKKRREWREKWMNMSEEERAQFRASWRKRCGKQGQEE
ncbi:MAG: hypothetical protein KDD06_03655 [Phaeodactylibacter sp.]|nr:hypothetical protein [Phaeodactylibacter sp.]